jgi:hypothetical protein
VDEFWQLYATQCHCAECPLFKSSHTDPTPPDATYIKDYIVPLCSGAPINSTSCFGTQNSTYYANPANSGSRSYLYTTCTESGLYQAAPLQGPTLLSRVLQADYTQQWCTWAFPAGTHNTIPSSPELWRYNNYGGYNVSALRLAHIDGEQDVWNQVCYHSDDAPARRTPNAKDAYEHPQLLISGAGHHWDSYSVGVGDVEAEPQFIRNAHLWEIRVVKAWLRECK